MLDTISCAHVFKPVNGKMRKNHSCSLYFLGTPDQNGQQTYAEMDDVEFSLCMKLNWIYICPHRQVITRPSRASCLYSLFMGNHQSSLEHCWLHLTTQDDDVVLPISKDTFILYTKKGRLIMFILFSENWNTFWGCRRYSGT